jgi:hypothetical protein
MVPFMQATLPVEENALGISETLPLPFASIPYLGSEKRAPTSYIIQRCDPLIAEGKEAKLLTC